MCSAAEMTVDSGAFATTIPRRVAASTSTLSTPTPARPITFSRSARSIRSAVSFVAERIDDRVVAADRLGEVGVAVDVDVEALAQQVDARLGDRLADEDPGASHAACARVRLERARDRDAALDLGAQPRRARARPRRARS